jgi:hypothetical protein
MTVIPFAFAPLAETDCAGWHIRLAALDETTGNMCGTLVGPLDTDVYDFTYYAGHDMIRTLPSQVVSEKRLAHGLDADGDGLLPDIRLLEPVWKLIREASAT